MEKFNLNFNGGENIIKSICWILSVLSWLMFLITGWISFYWFENNKGFVPFIWTIYKKLNQKNALGFHTADYEPLQMQVSLIYIVFILTMIIALVGFILYMIKSTCKKDENVFGGMIGNWSRFHFLPMFCASALFIIGECTETNQLKINHIKDMHIAGFIFTIIGLCSLIFIYIMTDLNTDWYIVLTIKKGTFSCLITLMWYYFCYSIYYIRSVDKYYYNLNYDPNDDVNWKKGCGLAFSIIFGVGSLIFAFFFKDLVVAGMTTLIYIGLTAYYFNLENSIRKESNANKQGDGIVDIIMMVLSVALIVFLVIKYRQECIKS